MPIEITPTGEIVTLECLLKTPNVCLFPEGVGPVLLYMDEKQRLWNVCRACAEEAFLSGEWKRAGEKLSSDKISKFELLKDRYNKLGDTITDLLKNLLTNSGIKFNSITYRIKSIESLEQKINSQGNSELEDISDLVGVRVITPFADDVNRIGNLIEQEFDIISTLSRSNQDYKKEDTFGYPSMHYVVMLSQNRQLLPEYKLVSKLKAEVQVRSIIQQAWAELAHEIQFKAETEIPTNMKRQLSRLAALLELADQEFVEFRNKRQDYTAEIERLMNN